jgi:membrane protein YdbS with pleckstrin-like domain
MKLIKTWLLAALIVIILLLLTYLGIAFITLKFNPYSWSMGNSVSLVFMAFVSILLSPMIYIAIKEQ